MRLERYIKEGRSVSIDKNVAIELLLNRCRKHLLATMERSSYIFRGLTGSRETMMIEPKKSKPRRSANTTNFFTLWHDNAKTMSDYPKRSQSIVCSTSDDKAYGYGRNLYLVFPEDGAKIGVVQDRDIFDIGYKGPQKTFLAQINNRLSDILGHYEDILNQYGHAGRFNFERPFDESWKKLQNLQKGIDFVHKDELMEQSVLAEFDTYVETRIEKIWHKVNHSIDEWYKVSMPKSGFKLHKAGDDFSNYNDNECWTDGFCVLIDMNLWEDGEFQEILLERL